MNQHRYTPPPHTGLAILHKDDALLVLNKPSGLLSVAGRGADRQDCLTLRVQAEYPQAMSVHRLDMDTSGIMVMARDRSVHRQLSRLFQAREVHKHYVAVVDGRMQQSAGEIVFPLTADWPNRPRQMAADDGKPARTEWRVLARDAASTLVALAPLTGRSHQREALATLLWPELDAARARDVLAALGVHDVGQAAVAARGQMLGIETLQGTDAMLDFVAATAPAGVATRAATKSICLGRIPKEPF